MVKKQKGKGNVLLENMVFEKLQDVLMWVSRSVKLGVKSQKVRGISNYIHMYFSPLHLGQSIVVL